MVLFQDEYAIENGDENTRIDAEKCVTGIRRFLSEKNSVIVLGLDEDLQKMYVRPAKKPKVIIEDITEIKE